MCSAVITSEVAGRRDEDVRRLDDVLEPCHLVAVHRRLQRADRIDLGDDDAGALATQRLRTTLADVAIAAHDRDLAADQHVGRAVDAVDQRVATAVLVVELRLRHRVVDVDRREQQLSLLGELVQPVHAGCGLLGHALDPGGELGPALRVLLQRALQHRQHDAELLGVGGRGIRHRAGALELDPLVDEQRRVAAVVEDHVGAGAIRPAQSLLGAPPVLLERLALPGVDRHPARVLGRAVEPDDNRGRGVVLGREDVARRPPHLRPERDQRLDQYRRLDRHVQRAGDPRAGQRLAIAVLAARRHQSGHLVLGQPDLLAAEGGQLEVGDLEVGFRGGGAHCVSTVVISWYRLGGCQ